MDVKQFLTRLAQDLGEPFLPDGFVGLTEYENGSFEFHVGPRDIHIGADGEFIGAGTYLGSEWRVFRKSPLEQLAEQADEE